jgi:hypothetical protein
MYNYVSLSTNIILAIYQRAIRINPFLSAYLVLCILRTSTAYQNKKVYQKNHKLYHKIYQMAIKFQIVIEYIYQRHAEIYQDSFWYADTPCGTPPKYVYAHVLF